MRFHNPEGQQCPVLLYIVSGVISTILLLSSCSNAVSQTTRRATVVAIAPPADLLTAHVLTVGSYINYQPQEYIDRKTKQATGFDIDLIKAIAQRMSLRVTLVPGDFQSLVTNLLNKDFDVVISAVSITPQLQEKVDFIPYFQGGESLLVAQGNPLHIQSTDDLCGLAVGVKASTFEQHDLQDASDMCNDRGKASITAVVVQKNADVVQLLATKRVVATYQDAPMTDFYVKQNPKLFEKAGEVVDATIEGIAVRKGDTTMFNAIKKALTELEADGTYHTLINKWGLMSGDIMAVH